MYACRLTSKRSRWKFSATTVLLCSFFCLSLFADKEQLEHLRWMQENLANVPEWNAWQERTGELPPDFDSLPRSNFLPDPLSFFDGSSVEDGKDWSKRRLEILDAYQQYLLGSFPPKPKLSGVETVETSEFEGYSTQVFRLQYGPSGKASLRVEISTPDGGGPFPVVITPSLGGWKSELIPRGYAAVGYAANDFMDDTVDLVELYPEYDFATLPRRAWAIQPVLDYIEKLPEIDKDRIGLYGYSRNGKMATIAAALEERIDAVIAGSTGVGGVLPWRLLGEWGMGESIESTSVMFPDWFHPRMRFFAGHEDRLPVDANLLVAAIAPRACLMQFGLNDEVSSVWATEQVYESALEVYELLGHPDRLGLLREPGFHGSIDPDKCLDWLDIQFDRAGDSRWDNDRMFEWDFEEWSRSNAKTYGVTEFPIRNPEASLLEAEEKTINSVAEWETRVEGVKDEVERMLGNAPPQPPAPVPFWLRGREQKPRPGPTNGEGSGPGQLEPDVPAWVIGRSIQEFGWVDEDNDRIDSLRLSFGDGLHGDLFLPKERQGDERLPTVIWLHGYSYPLGYMWVYRRDTHPVLALAKAGYAVFAFDQTGFGYRQDEAAPFYDRYPQWSRLGRMVRDLSAALDKLQHEEVVDDERIYALGYTLGGTVGLHAAALDERLRGVVSVSGFSPFRTDSNSSGMGGLERYSHQRSLLPQMGLFIGEEKRVPYDFDELIGAIAPRPVLVVQPTMGRGAETSEVKSTVERAREVYELYGNSRNIELYQPEDYTRFTEATQTEVIDWMLTHLP